MFILQIRMQLSYPASVIAYTYLEAPIPNVMDAESFDICLKHKLDMHFAVHKSDVFLK